MAQIRQQIFVNSAVRLEKLELRRLQERVERLFLVLQESIELEELNSPNAFSPPIDLCETDEAVCISVELPGLEPKDINLLVTAKDLIIEGEKKTLSKYQKSNFSLLLRKTIRQIPTKHPTALGDKYQRNNRQPKRRNAPNTSAKTQR
jgi:HSP20 family molecular chaperone IbpA